MKEAVLEINKNSIRNLEWYLGWFRNPDQEPKYFSQSLIFHENLDLEYDEDVDAHLRPAMYYENHELREDYLRYESMYISFFCELFDEYNIFIFDCKDYDERPIDKEEINDYQFQDKNEFKEYIRSCLRKRIWFHSHFICLDSLDHIIYINFDLVLINFQIKEDKDFQNILGKYTFKIDKY